MGGHLSGARLFFYLFNCLEKTTFVNVEAETSDFCRSSFILFMRASFKEEELGKSSATFCNF